MEYDPIKLQLARFFGKFPLFQKIFYAILDLLLLRAWHIHRELRLWARENRGHKHILDAGSGLGQYCYYMSNLNPEWSILAVDVKEEEVTRCNDLFRKLEFINVIFKIGDLTKLDQENAFDLILCVDVMEHIKDDTLVFTNFHKALKENGMLLISTPSDEGGSDVHSDEDESFIGEHVRDGYNIKEIKERLKNIGFSKVKARFTYGIPGKISWRLSMKYPILMLNKSRFFYLILPFYYLIIFPFCFLLNYIDTHTGHTTGSGLVVKAWK